ncbi:MULTISPECIES: DnaA regulatory inactivator Hda [Legionella]|uniref:DnaA regulatory inactivator Hda n=1 Tax=Legionella septentrionalis TaxID=2498109 RepID=A0A3S0WSL3_9GAMM|nr:MULTISPECIES: DnaA regulatory inactivator Hda [Legionella]MCP0912814.1 DnaA regulatory inactivator Hda [Legionella sp. 27cVA30]RUQ89988.1 DnaA regulatory inactivator Hda [Legionella septentrionalis]RUQ97835.1 DnaA regulatory inactivator Hda [Legionella septentrionalis]RUR11240.1 DnaA regulatory inactivator Hda [Legionella septentrionalis]RUR16295.1 DnaA regulatory inactivator Hda [Legionella septentrionalis]
MNRQLALAIQLNDEATLTDFCWEGNPLLQQHITAIMQSHNERFLFLWGTEGSGKSHLLQACCHASKSHAAIYLPLNLLKEWGPQVLDGLEEQKLICIDDVDAIAKDRAWEEALFHLYNRVRDNESAVLIMSGKHSPAHTPISLPDLRSRLSWGLALQLHELSDDNKINTLIARAQKRGFDLPTNVGQFLLNRCARNMHDLLTLLDRLDEASLIAQRKITIPFVKNILGV